MSCSGTRASGAGLALALLLLLATLGLACSGSKRAEEPRPVDAETSATPESQPEVPKQFLGGLWASTSLAAAVGLGMRVEPGSDQAHDHWRFRLSGGEVECRPQASAEAIRLGDCSALPRGIDSFSAVVPLPSLDTIELEMGTRSGVIRTELKRVPDRDEPQSANVELVWHYPRRPGCGIHTGIWAEDGLVFAPCSDGSIVILDAPTGRLLGATSIATARGPASSAVLEVTARGSTLYAATTEKGLVVFDVSNPAAPRRIGQYYVDNGEASPLSFTNVHNLTLAPGRDLLFAVNQSHPATDLRAIDISNPALPREVGVYSVRAAGRPWGGAHDVALEERDGRLLAYLNRLSAGFYILDVTDPANMRELGVAQWPNVFSHSGQPFQAAGRHYFAHTDEGYDGALTVLDVTNPASLLTVSTFRTRPGVSIHNLKMAGGLAFISYYLDGLRVLDLRDPARPREIAHYDTVPSEEEHQLFQGAWGVHVDGGLVFISDMQAGVFAFRLQQTAEGPCYNC